MVAAGVDLHALGILSEQETEQVTTGGHLTPNTAARCGPPIAH